MISPTRPRGSGALVLLLAVLVAATGCDDPRAATSDRASPSSPVQASGATATPVIPGTDAGARSAAPGTANPSETLAGAQTMLSARALALQSRDRTGFDATIASASTPGEQAAQRSAFDASTSLPIRRVTLLLGQSVPGPPVAGRWVVQVELRYELAGFDPAPVTSPETLALVRSPGGAWTVAADLRAEAPWDFGPLLAIRGVNSLVIVHPRDRVVAAALASTADAAIPVVTRTWGPDWSRRVVIVVPASTSELERQLDTSADLSAFAALQSAELTGLRASVGDRILLNRPVFLDRTSPLGQRVVLIHEITHVASSAVTNPGVPLWLVEGLADTVAFGATSLTPREGAPELAESIRSAGLPDGFPPDAAFAPNAPRLVQAYEQAWLACRLIEQRTGAAGLVGLYRAVGAGATVPDALVAVLHTTLGNLTSAWRAALQQELT